MTQREPGESPREQNEADEDPKVRGNETQEGPKGAPKGSRGDKRSREGFNSAQEDSKGKPKEAKRAKGGPGRHRRGRRVAKGGRIGEFDYCYTVS